VGVNAANEAEVQAMTEDTHQSASPQAEATGRRPVDAAARRVLILGLDGATFDVLDPLMAEGRMPRLAEAIRRGCAGVLHSTVPPITPAAWTTFLTGKQPGSHGIIDFERYDPFTNRLVLNSTRCLDHVRNLWQILSDRGLRVCSINVPMTYPPVPLNGCMISGFETPGPQAEFVYPPDWRREILDRWPDPTLRKNWRRKVLGGDRLFARNVDYMARSFRQGAEVARWCGGRTGWDVLMVVLKLVDNLQHKAWKHIDPRFARRQPRRREITRAAFGALDAVIGEMLDYADEHAAAVLMVSDHGHGSLDGKVYVNLLLQRWGYLRLRGGAARLGWTGMPWRKPSGGRGGTLPAGDGPADLPVDFTSTRACVMHAGMAGFLYVNLKGRQPSGIVEPAEYEPQRDELQARLLGPECQVRDPGGNLVPLFTAAHKPEELYGCRRKDQPWLPDLMLIPRDGLAVVRKIRGSQAVRWLSYRHLEGTHRPEGVLVATGPGVAAGRRVEARLVDCAPTVLALLGQRIPADMEGHVVADLFAVPPSVEAEPVAVSTPTAGARTAPAHAVTAPAAAQAYSAAELAQVKARLADLGYLE